MKRAVFLFWCIAFCSLVACATPPPTPPALVVLASPSVAVSPSPTVIVSPTPVPLTPTPPVLLGSPTPPVVEGGFSLVGTLPPDAATEQFQLSPDEQWISYLKVAGDNDAPNDALIPREAALHLQELASGAVWEVTSACTTLVCDFEWLPNGQFLWREEGALFVADIHRQSPIDLNAPEPIVEILGVTPDNVVLARSATQLWRLYFPDATWNAVPDPVAAPAPTINFVQVNDTLYVAEDGMSVAVVYSTGDTPTELAADPIKLVYLPLAPDAPATMFSVVDADSDFKTPYSATLLADSPYGLPTYCVNDFGRAPACLMDTASSEILSFEVVARLRDFMAPRVMLSPSRDWLIVQGVQYGNGYPAPGATMPPPSWYIVRSTALDEGVMVERPRDIEVVAWQAAPPAVFYYGAPTADGNTPLIRYSLEDLREEVLFSIPLGFESMVLSSDSHTFASKPVVGGVQLNSYAATGDLVRSELAPTDIDSFVAADATHLYYLYTNWNNTERQLWRWDAGE